MRPASMVTSTFLHFSSTCPSREAVLGQLFATMEYLWTGWFQWKSSIAVGRNSPLGALGDSDDYWFCLMFNQFLSPKQTLIYIYISIPYVLSILFVFFSITVKSFVDYIPMLLVWKEVLFQGMIDDAKKSRDEHHVSSTESPTHGGGHWPGGAWWLRRGSREIQRRLRRWRGASQQGSDVPWGTEMWPLVQLDINLLPFIMGFNNHGDVMRFNET